MKVYIDKKLLCLVISLLLILSLTACGRRSSETIRETEADEETETTQAETEDSIMCIDDMHKVIDAIEEVSEAGSFGINTKATLKLKGSIIKATYHFNSEVHVAQGANHQNMLMSSKSTSDMDDIVTTAYYKDGWYYTKGEKGKEKEEKSTDEVLELISGVTELVKDAAEKIEKVDIEKDGDNTVYTYELPAYMAQSYLKKLVDSAEVDQLKGASIKIDKAVLVSTVDENGLLKAQKVKINGSIHKLIITVPASAVVTAKFTTPDTEAPKIKTW